MTFESLSFEVQKEICSSIVQKELHRLAKLGYHDITCSESAIQFLALNGFATKYGARNMRDFIEAQIGDAIVNATLNEQHTNGTLIFSKSRKCITFQHLNTDAQQPHQKSDEEFLDWVFGLSKSRQSGFTKKHLPPLSLN